VLLIGMFSPLPAVAQEVSREHIMVMNPAPKDEPANVVKGRWNSEEDGRLRQLVDEIGRKWTHIATEMNSRNPQQCRDRWDNHLNPQKAEALTKKRKAAEMSMKATQKVRHSSARAPSPRARPRPPRGARPAPALAVQCTLRACMLLNAHTLAAHTLAAQEEEETANDDDDDDDDEETSSQKVRHSSARAPSPRARPYHGDDDDDDDDDDNHDDYDHDDDDDHNDDDDHDDDDNHDDDDHDDDAAAALRVACRAYPRAPLVNAGVSVLCAYQTRGHQTVGPYWRVRGQAEPPAAAAEGAGEGPYATSSPFHQVSIVRGYHPCCHLSLGVITDAWGRYWW
jgi:hypothetical protein